MKSISKDKKLIILDELKENKTEGAIAYKYKVSLATVSRLAKINKIKVNKNIGRPRKISKEHSRLIGRSFYIGKYSTAAEAQMSLRSEGYNISAETIRKTLKEDDFFSSIKKPALPLTSTRKKKRLAWAKKYKGWSVEDWKRVIFSDETKINRFGSDGKLWTWIKRGEPPKDHNVNFKYKGDGGSLMLWSCITKHGPGYIVKIEGGLDSKLYCDILGSDYIETLKYYGMNLKDVILQRDNDPKHTSQYTLEWMKKNNVKALEWPSYSPDLNPIENLWFYLKYKLAEYEIPPKNSEELWQRAVDIWYHKVTAEICVKHIESMPKRIKAVIKAKGGAIKW